MKYFKYVYRKYDLKLKPDAIHHHFSEDVNISAVQLK